MVTGDHGEEFNEYGYYGHNASFDPIAVRTTTLLHIPGRAPERITAKTSHVDLAPTILKAVGVTNPVSHFSTGRALGPQDSGSDFVVVTGWKTAAILDGTHTIEFRTDEYSPRLTVRDRSYRLIEDPDPVLRSQKDRLHEVARRFSAFRR